MKVLLYSEAEKLASKSGVGSALRHQKKALEIAGVEYTIDENDKYDIAHINTIGPGGERVLKKSKRKGIPVVFHTHTTYEDFRNSIVFSNMLAPLIKKRIKRLYSSASFLISPSEYTKKIIRSYGINLPIRVISNGIDNGEFTKNPSMAEQFKKQYNLNGPVVISVGLLFERKGIFDFSRIAKLRPDLSFFWFGSTTGLPLPRRVVKLLRKPPKNLIFPGFVPKETILGAYSACDAFFFPSYEENEGIVVLEALSMEAPIILRDIPVYSTWMKHDENCLKGKNIEEFKVLLESLIGNKELSKRLSSEGKKTAMNRDLSVIGQKLKEVYAELL